MSDSDRTGSDDGTTGSDGDGRPPSVVAEADVEFDEYEHGQRAFRRKRLGNAAGGEDLGTSLYELDPGNRTWPPHYHTGNEEAIYVLDGSLRLWHGAGEDRTEHDLTAGDYVALPVGEDHAHEVEATGEDPARFLVLSTMNEPDITVLPESGKVGLFAGSAPGNYQGRTVSKTLDIEAEADYWAE